MVLKTFGVVNGLKARIFWVHRRYAHGSKRMLNMEVLLADPLFWAVTQGKSEEL
jgi:hypothetical protein